MLRVHQLRKQKSLGCQDHSEVIPNKESREAKAYV